MGIIQGLTLILMMILSWRIDLYCSPELQIMVWNNWELMVLQTWKMQSLL